LEVGNLDIWRDFLDVRDVCAAYVACIDRRDSLLPGIILNIGSGHARRIGDVVADLMAPAGVTAEVRVEASRTCANDFAHAVANAGRARALFGWELVVPWSQTLSDVLQYWRACVAAAPDGA
jgi:GDP-4-dehydro-6-deoxy-D-mannose reductase